MVLAPPPEPHGPPVAGMLISLVICTRNRAPSLRVCLESLRGINAPCAWEAIVVDNGSTDSTRQVIEEFASVSQFPVRYVLEPRPGLSRARNRGVAVASGDPIVFTDDDCYPASDFLAAVASIFADENVDYFGGRVLLHDPDDFPVTIKTSTHREMAPPGSFVAAGLLHGANMGFRRRVFDELGGFNESLGAGSAVACGEDIEYAARASAHGFLGGYFPEPVVSHCHGRKRDDALELMRGYDVGRGAYYAAMILGTNCWRTYLREWVQSMSWKHRHSALREITGGARYAWSLLRARLRGDALVPRFPVSERRGRDSKPGAWA